MKTEKTSGYLGIDPGLEKRKSHFVSRIKKRVTQRCNYCGEMFDALPSEVKRGGGLFCSKECYYLSRVGENNPNWQGGGLEFTCQNCGKKFRLAKNELNRQKGYFCSHECHFKFRSKKKMPDIQRRISRNMHGSVKRFLKKGKEGSKWQNLVGYNVDDLRRHLEKDFRDGMTWENHGKWHIDHIIPISKFNFSSFKDEGFKKAWALNNLQPLWADENMKKGRRWRWY